MLSLQPAKTCTSFFLKYCQAWSHIFVNDFFNLNTDSDTAVVFFCVSLLMVIYYFVKISLNPAFVILCNKCSSVLQVMTKFIIIAYILRGSKTEPGGMPLETSSQTNSALSINTL